jgi:peptidoglycan/LPS O-acetylase OafA/YrhL
VFPFHQSWSLGIEEKFYLVWPMLAFGLLHGRKWPRRAVTLSIILLFIFSFNWANMMGSYRLEDYSCILMGALLALILEDREAYALVQGFGRVSFSIVVTSLVVLHFFFLSMPQSHYGKPLYAILVTMLLGMLLSTEGLIQRLLANSILVFIGRVSYGVYLVHVLCFYVAERLFRPERGLGVPVYLFTCLLSVVVAYILHLLIEQPMIGIGKQLLYRTLERRTPVPVI